MRERETGKGEVKKTNNNNSNTNGKVETCVRAVGRRWRRPGTGVIIIYYYYFILLCTSQSRVKCICSLSQVSRRGDSPVTDGRINDNNNNNNWQRPRWVTSGRPLRRSAFLLDHVYYVKRRRFFSPRWATVPTIRDIHYNIVYSRRRTFEMLYACVCVTCLRMHERKEEKKNSFFRDFKF